MVWPQRRSNPPPLSVPWTSSDGLLSSLSMLGVCCCLAGRQLTIGNWPVFLLPDFKPPNSQKLPASYPPSLFPLVLPAIFPTLADKQDGFSSRQYGQREPNVCPSLSVKRQTVEVYSDWLSSCP